MKDRIPVLMKLINLSLGCQDFTTRSLQLHTATRLLGCKPLHYGIKNMRVMPCKCLLCILQLLDPPGPALLLTVAT